MRIPPAFVLAVAAMIAVWGCSASSGKPVLPPGSAAPSRLGLPPASGSVPADVARARADWAARDDFADCEGDRPLEEVFAAFAAKDWKKLHSLAEPWSRRCPVDIDARFANSIALKELGREAEYKEEHRWTVGLVDAVLSSGDGRTPETAYVVLSVPEEYSMLRLFGFQSEGQALLENDIDVLHVKDEEGRKGAVYFNPEAHFRRLNAHFEKSTGAAKP